jgi:formylglycine-generating enzyme required for sulfatase activity/CRP-like cAMP-binding protein/chromosome segregation ATPase
MRAAKKIPVDRKLLQELVPLNALTAERFKEVSEKIVIEEVLAGRYLFRKGDRDNQSIYILEGKVNLIDGFRKVTSEVEAGTDISRYPIANQQPRPLSARAVKKVIIARVDSSLLDVFLTWDQSSTAEAVEIGSESNEDWMTHILQSEAFIKIPPSMIQGLLIKMEQLTVKAGDTIIQQGDNGDYFYTIHQGRCAVTRRETPDGEDKLLAELVDGDSFGEDALVSDARRNASVSMLTDGLLMRLAKQDFVELLKNQLVKRVDYDQAVAMVDDGAVWVDVRTPDEYENSAFEDSVNLPLSSLRDELSELVFNSKYIVCCDTGRRSESAGFLLSHKGFDVYVLEGGMAGLSDVSVQPVSEADSADAAQSADVLDFAGGGDEAPAGPAETDDNRVPGEHSEVLDRLRTENASLGEQLQTFRDTEARLNEQLEQLRGELGESSDKLADLYTQARIDAEQLELLRGELGESGEKLGAYYEKEHVAAEESQLLQEQYHALQEEFSQKAASDKQTIRQLQVQLDELQGTAGCRDDEYQSLKDEFSKKTESDEQTIKALQAQLGELQDTAGERDAEYQTLRTEFSRQAASDAQTIADLQTRLDELQGTAGQRNNEYQALQEEFSRKTESDEQTIKQLQAQLTELQGAAASRDDEHRALAEQLAELAAASRAAEDDYAARLQQKSDEASGLEQALAEVRAELEAKPGLEEKAARVDELDTFNAGLTDQVETLRTELENSASALTAAEQAAAQRQQEYEQEIKALHESLEQHKERLSETAADQAATTETLQRDNEALRTELRDASVLLDEHKEQVVNLQADKQAADEAQQRQHSEREAERSELQQALDAERQALESLREELSRTESQASEERSALAEDMKTQLARANEKIERLEIKRVELKQKRSAQDEELELAEARHAELQAQLSEHESRNSELQAEIDAIKGEAESKARELEEERSGLQAQLEHMCSKVSDAQQLVADSDSKMQQLDTQLTETNTKNESLQEERELLQQQLNDLQLQVGQQEERARALEEENKAAEMKAHEDLTRKNDNEKELQGQIDRLRKKMAQQTADYQKAREDAREDTDQLREQLNVERQARAEERSEMAARQRELKEQLALVASEHETNLSNQNGAIKQARDAARQEEQEHLREILSAQQETENQVDRLQKELKAAHEEIAELTRQEKDRRQVDVDLMEEQNQQAVTTISQLEAQLRQLTSERDTALEDQQALRDRMNTLRGEVEVARGLMGASDQMEDPARLRSELNESKKNIEIALRLRAEAESARDRMEQERDALQSRLESGETPDVSQEESAESPSSEPLHVPSLDGGDTGAVHPGPGEKVQAAALPIKPAEREHDSESAPLVDVAQDGKQRRWLGAAIGLGVVLLCVLAGWFFIAADAPVSLDEVATVIAANPDGSDAEDNSPAASIDVPQSSPDETVSASAVDAPEEVAEVAAPEPVVETVTSTPEVVAPATASDVPPTRVVPGNTFRDALKGGAEGPAMVELPAGNYQMGSPGNSLNYDEVPRHAVSVPAFAVSQYEVTFAEYDRFARATGRRLPYDESWGRGDRPVINVSWSDARAYTRWLSDQTGKSYRLPSEAEWEYAARAGSLTNFWWQDVNENRHANCFNCGSDWDGARTAPVGSFAANDFGLHDVAGNVQEWTADCYHGSYQGAPTDGSAWAQDGCDMRVVRGGAYTSPLDSLRSAKRSQYSQDARLDNLGFRVVRTD